MPPPPGIIGAVSKFMKKSGDPRPKTGVQLRKVFLGQLGPQALSNTFWVKLHDTLFAEEGSIKLDWQQLEDDFKDKEPKAALEIEKPADKVIKTTKEGILEDKKVNQFEIILSRFELNPTQARDALISLKITYDQASQVFLLLPEEDDCNRILEWQGDESTLAVATRIVRDLLRIPRVKIRVKCIIAKHEFAMDVGSLGKQMKEYLDTFEMLQVVSIHKTA